MSEVNQVQRAAVCWEVLTTVSHKRELILYVELARQIGIHYRPVRYVLGLIQDYCLENHLPPLTILVVNRTGLPGSGFIAWDVDNIVDGLEQVYNYNWSNLDNPFGYARQGPTEDQIIDELLINPNNTKEIYSRIKVRGAAQPIFRKVLLKAYENKCAFCDFSFLTALQASHIKPWTKSSNNERLDVRNGILLCSTHHRLFDNGFLKINYDYTITYYDPQKNNRQYSEYDNLMATKLHGKKIRLPKNKEHWPRQDFMKWHYDNFTSA